MNAHDASTEQLQTLPRLAVQPTAWVDDWSASIRAGAPFGSYADFGARVSEYAAAVIAFEPGLCFPNGLDLAAALPTANCSGAAWNVAETGLTAGEIHDLSGGRMSTNSAQEIVDLRSADALETAGDVYASANGPWKVSHLVLTNACIDPSGGQP